MRFAAQPPAWGRGCEDAVWGSRVTQPALHAWTAGPSMRGPLLTSAPREPVPDAVACDGGWRHATYKVLCRCVDGRPLGAATGQGLEWLGGSVAQEGKQGRGVLWDAVSWHPADVGARWGKE